MTTTENIDGNQITIEWTIKEQFDNMGDGHETLWNAEGFNAINKYDPNCYCSTAVMIDGEFTEIQDVFID